MLKIGKKTHFLGWHTKFCWPLQPNFTQCGIFFWWLPFPYLKITLTTLTSNEFLSRSSIHVPRLALYWRQRNTLFQSRLCLFFQLLGLKCRNSIAKKNRFTLLRKENVHLHNIPNLFVKNPVHDFLSTCLKGILFLETLSPYLVNNMKGTWSPSYYLQNLGIKSAQKAKKEIGIMSSC